MRMEKGRARRRATAAVILLLGLLSAAGASAQLPPLSTGDKDFPKALAPVVEAEHAFAMYSIEHGMKEAFLHFAAPDGIIFRRTPVNAIEAWTQTTPAPTGLLTWWPIYADVSRAGDLGYAYGTYELKTKASDEKPAEQGNYVRMWKRQGGAWRVVLDVTNPVRPQ